MTYRWWIAFDPNALQSAQPREGLNTPIQCALLAVVLALPPVERVVGVSAWFSAPAVLSYGLWTLFSHRVLVPRAATQPWAFHTVNGVDHVLGVAIAIGLPVASGNPISPLWAFVVMFSAMQGADYDYEPTKLMAGSFTLGPLLGIPVYLAKGVPMAPAIGAPLFFAVCCFVSYTFLASRRIIVRKALAERDELRSALAEERMLRERERLARDLHDSIGASLSTAALYADLLGKKATDPEETEKLSATLAEAAREGLGELRALLDVLSPDEIDAQAFAGALEAQARRRASGAGVKVSVVAEGERYATISSEVRFCLARVFQEALSNALRHAQASVVHATLAVGPDEIRLVVEDDGCGYDPASEAAGRGVRGMRERLAEMGGTFRMESNATQGTRVVAALAHESQRSHGARTFFRS
jgi:signal transduction histidine kinase